MTVSGVDLSAAAARVSGSLAPRSTAVKATTGGQAAASTSSANASTGSGGDISSNDFLTLLVTEMKNQDPTQPTDPNAYIQQLVGVNSLQQLIAINQDLTPPATTPAGSGANASGVSTTPSITNF